MTRSRVLTVVLLFVAACTARLPQELPPEHSGFLDDYSVLRPGGPNEVALVYRDPQVQWSSYDKVLFEPVTLWRSGRKSLDAVPEGDLQRLIADLQGAVRRRLGDGFELVESPRPGTMRIRLAITEAHSSDPLLDVMRGKGEGSATRGSGALHLETRRFVEKARIEGEIRDATTGALLAAGVDQRRREGALPVDTWADLDRALDFWADRLCARLEARTRERGSPRKR